MGVTVLISNLEKVKQGLVDCFLKLEDRLQGLQAIAAFILGGLLDVLKNNGAATVVLKLH